MLKRVLRVFDDLIQIAEGEDEEGAEKIREAAWRAVTDAEPIRVLHAHQLLGVSDQTVREWIEKGLLESAGSKPQRVTLDSVLETKLIVDELRELGRDRNLVSVALNRLEREELSRSERLRKSLEQMQRGERGEWPEGWDV